MRADCVIVGAGPAGSTTALLLARAGFDVILLDRTEFPRAKPCGDCISPGANHLLAQLGVWPALMAAQPARLEGWRITGTNGSAFTAPFAAADARHAYGLALPRQQLDAILLDAARAAGVTVVTRVRVDDLIHDAGSVVGVRARADAHVPIEVRAALTVGADGLHSVIRRRLHLQNRGPRLRKVALTAHVSGIAALTNFGEMHLLPGACVGIAPVDAGRQQCNLTLVLDRTRHGRSIAGKSIAAFLDHVNRFPGVRSRLDHARVHGLPLASGPFDQPTRGVVVPGAALVGDAAGYYDPFTGQGIYQAVAGGSLLARHATVALRRSRAQLTLTSYQRALRAAVRETRAVQRLLESICARPALANRCLHALSAAPEAATALVAVTGDLWPPHSLLSPAPLFSFLRHFARSAA